MPCDRLRALRSEEADVGVAVELLAEVADVAAGLLVGDTSQRGELLRHIAVTSTLT